LKRKQKVPSKSVTITTIIILLWFQVYLNNLILL